MLFLPRTEAFFCFLQKADTLHSRPGTLAVKRTLDVTKCNQAIQCRVHPIINGHVRRSHVVWVPCTFTVALAQISPWPTTQTWIVMRPVNLSSDVPSQRTSYKRVRREMLIARYTRECHCGSQTICKQPRERPRVLVREHPCSRPGEH